MLNASHFMCIYEMKDKIISYSVDDEGTHFLKGSISLSHCNTHWLCCLPFLPFTLLSQNSNDFLLFHCSQILQALVLQIHAQDILSLLIWFLEVEIALNLIQLPSSLLVEIHAAGFTSWKPPPSLWWTCNP